MISKINSYGYLWATLILAPLLIILVSIIPNALIINQLSRADTQSFISKENYPPSRDGAFVSDRYTECVAMTMGIKIDQSSFLDGLKGEFVGNCYDLQIALNKTPPSLDQISEHFMEWQKAQGINHASEYSYSKETYKKHFSNDGLKLGTLIKDFFIFFNSAPSLDSRLRRIETSASEPHPYIRFWHGYQILTRPVLALSSIESLRFISACFFILSLTLVAYFLRKKEMGGGIIAGLFLILMLISLDIKEIITNYIHAITLSAMFLSSLATVYFNRAHQKILAGFWGMYFSFLLNIQIGLIMVFWLSWVAYQPKSLAIKEYKPLFKNTILWSIGILFSFLYKYGLVSFIFFNQNNISLFTDALWDRSFAGHNTATEFVYDYFAMLGSNLKFWSFLGFRFWIVLLSAFLVFIYQMTNKKLNKSYLQVELLIILLGFVSLGILLNHSLLHSIFVWRIMPFIASLIILTGVTGILKRSR